MADQRSFSTRIRTLGSYLSDSLTQSGQPLAWTLRGYRREKLPKDGIGGLTVAALIVPLSIGYAQVAGLPPEAGLYASLVPLLAYAVFGSSRRLIVGPDAATAALVGAAIVPLAVAADDRIRIASALGLLVAVVFIAMRLATLGFLSEFLSRPLLVGYMTGVGINVAMGQVPKILGGSPLAEFVQVLSGIDLRHVEPGAVIGALGIALTQTTANVPSAVLGGLVLAAILAGERWLPRVPMALPALLVALGATALLDLPSEGVRVLGPIPSGLPPIGIPLVSIDQALTLLPAALGIAILSFADTALTGRNFAEPHGERTDPNRELLALAAADLGGSLTSGYPISSSASRTQAAEAAGGQTQMTGIVAAGAVALVLVFLTGPMALLPIPALGAIVLAGALHFIKAGEIARIWRIQRREGIVAIVAAVCVVAYGTLVGVGVAALLAALNVFVRASRPHMAELGRVSHDDFADVARTPGARRIPGILVVRFAGPLFFATATALGDRVRELAAGREPLTSVVLDAYSVVDLDLTASDALRTIERELGKAGTTLVIARPTGALRDLMRTFGLGHLVEDDDHRLTLGEIVDRATVANAEAGGGEIPPVPTGEDAAALADTSPAASDERVIAGRPTPTRGRPKVGVVAIAAIAVVGVLIAALTLGQRSSVPPPTGAVTTPNLVGIPVDRARSVTEGAGLVFGLPTYRQTNAYPEGTVISQDPGPGVPVAAGSTIAPTVSTARELVTVPDVVGSPQSDAIFAITTAGLRVGSTTRAADQTVPAGAVVSASPDAGRAVAVGTSVALIVSSGPEVAPSVTASPVPSAGGPPTATPSAAPGPTGSPSSGPSESPESSPLPSPGPSIVPSDAPAPSASPRPS